MQQLEIKVKNYKCFKEPTGFERIQRVNLIIGRNNSGKSSLLDLIEAVTSSNYIFDTKTQRNSSDLPQILFSSTIPESAIKITFPSSTSGGLIGMNHLSYGEKFINRAVTWTKGGSDGQTSHILHCDDNDISPRLTNCGDNYPTYLANNLPICLEGKVFKRLFAERDILPELSKVDKIEINSNGSGLTNAIQCFINKSNYPSDLVERKLLKALNRIFAHDAFFTDIVCQLHDTGLWEIYLEEESKGRIPLSQSGSGIKTVMTVLSYLILVPYLERKSLDNFVFGFEELENNIHPALLRRLNQYIYELSIEQNFIYFLTTHSNVLIDQFSKQDDAQIVHVSHDQQSSVCTTAQTYIDNNGILDDLDIRASDILQANGIIWVEGPSDRVYINRWIYIWSNGELKEGTHYQVVFYGGRLLSHLSAETPDNQTDGISLLRANRNALIMIDSDKRAKSSRLNGTKKRIIGEFEKLGGFCWITQGKEIENYIPKSVVNDYWNKSAQSSVERYSSFFDYLDGLVPNEGKKYSTKKTLLAEKLAPFMTRERMAKSLDLDQSMNKVCETIRAWNI
ncbi:ATP-dependent nuclease [Vibrio mediterranei]|jgi:hypothetical protein|uniref:ATP-dependent nuclease n=1 Tax=Vibrio mediterranei TaxID=689 RepID=UPI00228386B2|nr:AAA family ATPase [Vibrio mediterranei]MCY9855320.1 AAA family ATPase [Vibrio mediterranei]